MHVLSSIFNWFIRFCGNVFVWCGIAAAVFVIIEIILYRTAAGRQQKGLSSGTPGGDNRLSRADASFRKVTSSRTGASSREGGSSRKKRIALVTGASSGLGRQMIMEMDATEKNIDEFWLIARRRERMEALSENLSRPSVIIPLDLMKPESIDELKQKLTEAEVEIGVLVNSAGLGKIGNYAALTTEENNLMIDLNDRAAVDVTMIAIPFMKAGDRIIEICSTAAFQPLQHFSVYAASKSFLYNYSRALRLELLPKRIPVTAVCPYWMKDTEFIPTASKTSSSYSSASPIRNFALAVDSKTVARRVMRDSRAGFAVSTPGLLCTLHRFFGKLVPRETLLYIWEVFRKL
ncbi:MAG: SDR family NAD(P)-dependent oxidoreductase [Eubacteriales bacterium]|jgi:short-subunit dehydrogenase